MVFVVAPGNSFVGDPVRQSFVIRTHAGSYTDGVPPNVSVRGFVCAPFRDESVHPVCGFRQRILDIALYSVIKRIAHPCNGRR